MQNKIDMEFNIDYKTGEYICSKCKKHFTVSYYRKSWWGRTITREMPGAAKANFVRHLKACYKLWKIK